MDKDRSKAPREVKLSLDDCSTNGFPFFPSQRELYSGFDHLTIKASKCCMGRDEVKTLIV